MLNTFPSCSKLSWTERRKDGDDMRTDHHVGGVRAEPVSTRDKKLRCVVTYYKVSYYGFSSKILEVV